MNRLQALEAVAEAALGVSRLWGRGLSDIGGLRRALAALDALPADPAPAEVVEVAVWVNKHGEYVFAVPGSDHDEPEPRWTRLGTTPLPLAVEAPR